MRMEWYQRKLAVFLSVILMLEPVVQVLPAMAYGKTVMEIAEFEELDESVMVQTVPYGTAYEDLDLPDYLSAHVFEVTVEDEEEDEEVASGSDATSSDASSSAATPANASSSAATVSDASGEGTSGGDDGYRMIPVTWELSSGPGGLSDYDGETAGTYVFDAVLAAGGYRLGDAILPFIEVEVLEAEPLAVTALLTTNGELIDISDATVVIDGTYTYDGSEQVPSKDNIRVILNGEEIHLSDYSIASPNVNAGTAIVSVNVMNDDTYTGTAYGYFEIQPAGLTVSGVTFENTKREYDGTNEVKVSGVTLSGVIGNDDVSVDERGLTGTVDSANVGTYTSVTLSGLSLTGADAGNYTVPEQTVNANVTISPKTLTGELGISVSPNTYEYDKTEKEPNVRVLIDGVQISESEYTVSYENNVNTGTATATATLTGNYSGSVTGDFTIHPKELTVTGATVSDRVYDGTKVVTVTGVTLDGVLGTDVVSVDVSGISGELDSADAGTYSSVQLAGSWSLDGKDAGNYTVTEPTSAVSTTVTISPKTVSSPTITLSETTYEYDGTEKKP
ncbi:MAG: YDG domain-containing protein, partial [Clostridiales bacterium]|nr:YDG domain-containing protein [Clostridiales bacterium]